MKREEIKSGVKSILKKYTRKEEVWENATDDSKILEDLKINSARLVDIILDLEDQFDVDIDDDAIDDIITVNDAIKAIESRLA